MKINYTDKTGPATATGALKVIFIGADGFRQEIGIADLWADTNAINAMLSDGSARNIFPS